MLQDTANGVSAAEHVFRLHGTKSMPCKGDLDGWDFSNSFQYDSPEHGLVNTVSTPLAVCFERSGHSRRRVITGEVRFCISAYNCCTFQLIFSPPVTICSDYLRFHCRVPTCAQISLMCPHICSDFTVESSFVLRFH